jgi:hypothetical protein
MLSALVIMLSVYQFSPANAKIVVRMILYEILERLVEYFYLPRLERLEKKIGCRLAFRNLPDCYINGWMSCDMTRTWKNAGIDIERGVNYFTMGKIVDGTSSRFDLAASEYQSWFGGYTVKLTSPKAWSFEDHFKLAIADQNSWLRRYGDPNPMTTVRGWKAAEVGKIQIGSYGGTLYEFGCTTHSDVGGGRNALKLRLACMGMATVFNLSNPRLKLKEGNLRPRSSGDSYASLRLRGYMAIFNIGNNKKVVFYANGTSDTFATLKEDLSNALRSCEIIKM